MITSSPAVQRRSSPRQREEDLNGLYAVAADSARTLEAHIFPSGSYQSEEELMALIVADSPKKSARKAGFPQVRSGSTRTAKRSTQATPFAKQAISS